MSEHEEQAFPLTEPEPMDSPLVEGVEGTGGGGADADHDQIYHPPPGELQLTARAIVTGCFIGSVVGAMNISIGLKIGWSFGGSLIAAILGYAFWHLLRPKKTYGVLETNITQTTGSAAGSMASAAGLLAPIPALALLEGDNAVTLSYVDLTLWALSVGFLGMFFAVPLRNQYVVTEKLRFPTGTATAETIMSIFAEGAEAMRKARVLLAWAIIAAGFVLFKYKWFEGWFGPVVEHPPIDWLPLVGGTMTLWGVTLLISPVMFGAGLLIGPRIGISLLLGALVSWLILGPIARQNGWVNDTTDAAIMSYANGPRGWILWPGVAIMVGDALMSLALSWRTIINTFTAGAKLGRGKDGEHVPNLWWMGGLAAGSLACVIVSQTVFHIPWYFTLIAIALSSILAAIAVRSVGETDINPVGGMGKVTQLAFGAIAPGSMSTNLMAAAISGAGASQAGDMMQDLKTGYMLGASPRKQIIAQLCGVTAGVFVVVPIYKLFDRVHDIGGAEGDYPAPAAHAWKAMAELLAKGLDALPPHAMTAVVLGLIFGAAMPTLRKFAKPIAPLVPSGLAFGIAFIVPAYYAVAMCIGSIMLVLWRKTSPKTCTALVFAVASGLIAGEGLTNVLTALMDLARQTFLSGAWPAV